MDESLRNDITELIKEMIPSEPIVEEQQTEQVIEMSKEDKENNIRALRNKFFSPEITKDIDRVRAAVELRDALVDAGYPDPGMPAGHAFVPGSDTAIQCEHAWNGLKQCLEVAGDSDEYFRAELARLMPDKKII